MTFFVWYLAAVWEGQLMTSLETSTNAIYTANVLVITIKALEKITHSYKNKTLKTSPGYCPLKGDVTKIDDFFQLQDSLALENIFTVFCTAIQYGFISNYFFFNKVILIKMSLASTYKFIFLQLTVDIQHKKHKTETDSANYFQGDLGWRESYIFRKENVQSFHKCLILPSMTSPV